MELSLRIYGRIINISRELIDECNKKLSGMIEYPLIKHSIHA